MHCCHRLSCCGDILEKCSEGYFEQQSANLLGVQGSLDERRVSEKHVLCGKYGAEDLNHSMLELKAIGLVYWRLSPAKL